MKPARFTVVFGAVFFTMAMLLLASQASFVAAHGGDPSLIHTCVGHGSGFRLVKPSEACKRNETALDWAGLARVTALEDQVAALGLRPDVCAPAAPGIVITDELFTADFHGTPRSSFGSGETVHVHAPATDSGHQVRNLWFDPTGWLVPEATSVLPGNRAPIDIGLQPASGSTRPGGQWRVFSCYEKDGLTDEVGTVTFDVF